MTKQQLAIQRSKAHRLGGWREHYAMEHGTETITRYGNNDCLTYSYSPEDPYQDANGATFDMVQGKWIG